MLKDKDMLILLKYAWLNLAVNSTHRETSASSTVIVKMSGVKTTYSAGYSLNNLER